MTGNKEVRFADEDLEYATDAAAEVDAEQAGFDITPPADVPADLGDSGTADPPAGAS
jgi:hypothetical protein